MAHMMLFFELMRVKREYNAESRKQISITQKMDRMQKQIDRTTKYYTSLFTQLDNQAKSMQNNANIIFQNMAGGSSFSTFDYSGMSGLAQFLPQVYGKIKIGDSTTDTMSQALFEEMYEAYQANGYSWKTLDENGTTVNITGASGADTGGHYSADQIQAFSKAKAAASTLQNQVKTAVSNMSNLFQNGVTSWLEYQKALLEEEQDQALDALNYEETMLECDQTASKVRMEELKAEKESLQEELKERVQDDAPGFGL